MDSSMAQSHLGTNGKKPLKIKMHGKQEFQSPGTSRIIRKGGTRPKENKNGQPPDCIKARDANSKKVKVNNGTTIDPEFVSTSSDNSKNKIPKYYLEQGSNGTSGIKRPYINIVALSGVWNAKETPCISGGPLLNDVYVFDKLIFKWGGCDHTGSEHATDSKFYPLERQMIFRRDSNSVFSIVEPRKRCNNPECRVKDCNDLHEDMLSASQLETCFNYSCRPSMDRSGARTTGSSNEKNALEYVIISSFYEIFDCDPYSRNLYLDNVLKYVQFVLYPDTYYNIPVFSLDLIQEPFNCNYFSYFGSLTFPPFSENVLWIVQPDISFVSKQQMESLREIKSGSGQNVNSNRRSIQPLNKRCIYLCC
ncbi:uncharacterized protein LOC103515562 isoform X1 [Diaphorina citri]|uniref:Uncharacterized protein LOC103515562 isoform X1 n=1 Tax=Diaphorina citri TaxID=121845 RepID=A0A3Q0JAP2_DIACI|nr:uncharacterized protein LOC103515562 isoform X1 [Diaphorina citri]